METRKIIAWVITGVLLLALWVIVTIVLGGVLSVNVPRTTLSPGGRGLTEASMVVTPSVPLRISAAASAFIILHSAQ